MLRRASWLFSDRCSKYSGGNHAWLDSSWFFSTFIHSANSSNAWHTSGGYTRRGNSCTHGVSVARGNPCSTGIAATSQADERRNTSKSTRCGYARRGLFCSFQPRFHTDTNTTAVFRWPNSTVGCGCAHTDPGLGCPSDSCGAWHSYGRRPGRWDASAPATHTNRRCYGTSHTRGHRGKSPRTRICHPRIADLYPRRQTVGASATNADIFGQLSNLS